MDLKNHFLIAMPNQSGSYFGNTITYLCEHGEEGAMGLMINRPHGPFGWRVDGANRVQRRTRAEGRAGA